MTHDDIIRMAREAGYEADMFGFGVWDSKEFNRFAALVAAHEREACAKVADLVAREIDDTNGTATYIADGIRARGQA